MALNTLLKELRQEKGMTQAEAADFLGVNLSSYQKYERSKNTIIPSVDVIVQIADRYNVSTDYLLGRTPVRAMNTLPVGALSEEEVKEIDEAIVTGYTQLSLETRRAFIAMLEELFGNIFEREDFGEDREQQDSTA